MKDFRLLFAIMPSDRENFLALVGSLEEYYDRVKDEQIPWCERKLQNRYKRMIDKKSAPPRKRSASAFF